MPLKKNKEYTNRRTYNIASYLSSNSFLEKGIDNKLFDSMLVSDRDNEFRQIWLNEYSGLQATIKSIRNE